MSFLRSCLCAALCLMLCGESAAGAESLTVELRSADMNFPVYVPPAAPAPVTPAMKEKRFSLNRAVNYKQLAGRLSPEQKKILEKQRFLLLPALPGLTGAAEQNEGDTIRWDEMLSNFAAIGGSPHAEERKPENAVLVTPDPFLHALHKYVSERLKEAEAQVLEPALQRYLAAIYDNILRLKAQAGPANAAAWERLQVRMLVPLLLIRNSENCDPPEDVYDPDVIEAADRGDTLDNLLRRLDEYRSDLGPESAASVENELRLIYEATVAGGENDDYTRYRPRGHYEATARTRSYFRAMMHLGATYWDLQTAEGAADAFNFALAMSLPVSPDLAAKAKPADMDPIADWRTIMSISAMYAGYPDEACYPEWVDYVRARLGERPATPDAASDPALVAALREHLGELTARAPFFRELWTPVPSTRLRVFPQRFTVAWLVADHLTAKPTGGEEETLPATFSGLWMPVAFGSEYAAELLPEQARLLFAEGTTAGGDIGPLEPGAAPALERVVDYIGILRARLDALKATLTAVPEDSWFSSIGAAWLHLLRTQTATYGEGYPLYMQSKAFAAKQLQTYMGSYTELKHDMLLYEKANYAEGGEGAEGDIPPVPKGFVEPNLAFWHELLRVTRMLQVLEGAKPEDLGKEKERSYGGLEGFAWRIELCIRLAEKELRNEPITEEEYEELRTSMDLDFMAEPAGGALYTDPDQRFSGLIVDVQTDNENNRVVYEATAKPLYMLALVGNENSPRLVLGVVYNHYEFTAPHGPRFTDKQWKQRVYHEKAALPKKNFWYDAIR